MWWCARTRGAPASCCRCSASSALLQAAMARRGHSSSPATSTTRSSRHRRWSSRCALTVPSRSCPTQARLPSATRGSRWCAHARVPASLSYRCQAPAPPSSPLPLPDSNQAPCSSTDFCRRSAVRSAPPRFPRWRRRAMPWRYTRRRTGSSTRSTTSWPRAAQHAASSSAGSSRSATRRTSAAPWPRRSRRAAEAAGRPRLHCR
mmetsp:Transcript_7523/g.21876  ORF Transcript_7523/g.21876 Transcript_7523/m.21876 type:complete len:204 (-) Transcript_7523:743-1354(-)